MVLEAFEIPEINEDERTPLVELLLSVIQQCTLKLQELEAENAKLKERIARLEKNSSNSSKPPSSDITKPKNEQRQPGKRKIRAQPGHQANWRLKFKEEEIDRHRKLQLSRVPPQLEMDS